MLVVWGEFYNILSAKKYLGLQYEYSSKREVMEILS